MATNFSPCYGSYVLNKFPSIVMFGMKGFHISACGAIQGHHGPLVRILLTYDPKLYISFAHDQGGALLVLVHTDPLTNRWWGF